MISRICGLLKIKQPLLNRGFLFASGTTVPTDGTDGFQTGCIFQKTDGGEETALYVNEGAVTECAFKALKAMETAELSDMADVGSLAYTSGMMLVADGDSYEETDDIALPYTGSLKLGAFASLLHGSGVAVSSSKTWAAAVYSDDNNANIGDSCRGVLSRFLLTKDQTGGSIRALMGQLKLATGVDVTSGIYTASQGYLELAGTHSAKTGSTLSCFDASLEIGTALTVDSGGEACGIHVETTGSGTITNNGTCAGVLVDKAVGAADWPVGVLVKNSTTGVSVGACTTGVLLGGGAITTGISITATSLTDGIKISGTTPVDGIEISSACSANAINISGAGAVGVKITGATTYAIDIATSGVFRMGVQDTGVPLTTEYPFGMDVQTELNSDVASGATGTSAGIYARYAVEFDQTELCSHVAMFGKLRVKKALADGVHAGVFGYVEISGSGTVIGGTATTVTAAGHFAVEADENFELSTGLLNGVSINSSVHASATITGDMAALRIDKSAGKMSWTDGILIDGPSVVMGVRVGKFAGSAATTSAVLFSTDQDVYSDGQISTVEVHGASDANLTSAYAAKCLRARHVVNCTTAAHETYGAMGQCVVKDTTLSHLHAGVIGTFEGHTSGVVSNGAYTYSVAAVMARVGGGGAITATKDVCGVVAFWNGAALASGDSSAFAVGDSGTTLWTNALAVERATNLLALPALGTAPCSTQTTADYTFTKYVKVAITIGGATYYLIADTTA